MRARILSSVGLVVALASFSGVLSCDQGVPVPIDIERDFAFNINEAVELLEDALRTQDCGGAPCLEEGQQLPDQWPAPPAPQIKEDMEVNTPKQDVDLSNDPNLNQASKAVERVDINLIEFKFEVNTLNVDIPKATIQFADFGANPEMEGLWKTVAETPPIGAGETDTKKVTFLSVEGKDGREIISGLLKSKKFAMRLKSRAVFDTEKNPARPRGEGKGKIHLKVTFFLSAL